VALGDSFTSGPLIPTQENNPSGCMRSTSNYPSDTAKALTLTLTDVSCSGATTANMTMAQSVSGGTNPPQFNAFNNLDPQAVSVQIGLNDIGFITVLENCIALTPFGPTKVGFSCKSYYDPSGHDSLAAAINNLAPTMGSLIGAIKQDAPGTLVFVVGYPAILPASGSCWPSMPYESGDAKYLSQTEVSLNAMLAKEAAANGATYVDSYTPSVSHNACTPESTRWVEPVSPGSSAGPFHPNAAGETAMASLLGPAMKAKGIS